MNLWWMITSSSNCPYDQLKQRQCVALGWRELESLKRYIKPGNNWERRFKTFVQLRGNVAYSKDRRWDEQTQSMTTGVPQVFWDLLQIKQNDFIVVMETGSQMTLGRIEIRGFAKIAQDAQTSYDFKANLHHAHEACHGSIWRDWPTARFGELARPAKSFIAIHQDNDQLATVEKVWQQLASED